MITYSVGMEYTQFKGMPDGYTLEYRDGALFLYVMLRGWTAAEKKAVSVSEPIKFRFVEMNEVGFLCTKFGGMPWGDSPFHPAIYRGSDISLEIPEFKTKREGLPLMIVCADTTTGKVIALRLIGLGNQFSKEWLSWAAAKWDIPMSREEYNERINRVYADCSPNDLADAATLRWNLKV